MITSNNNTIKDNKHETTTLKDDKHEIIALKDDKHEIIALKDDKQNNLLQSKIVKPEIKRYEPEKTPLITAVKIPNVKNESYFKYEEDTRRFYVLDESKKDVGYFTHKQILKLISKPLDRLNKFMIEIELNDISVMLIKNQILDIETDGYFTVKTIEESTFIKDIKSVIQLNNLLREFKYKEFKDELEKVGDQRVRTKIQSNIEKFIHIFIIRSLEVLSIFSDRIKELDNNELKEKINKYTVSAVYESSQFVQKQVNMLMEQNLRLAEALNGIEESRTILGYKIDNMASKVYEQNKILIDIGNIMNNNPDQIDLESIKHEIESHKQDIIEDKQQEGGTNIKNVIGDYIDMASSNKKDHENKSEISQEESISEFNVY
jgi:hypothetical protein